MVSFLHSIVPFLIIKAIVDKSLQFGRFNLGLVFGKIIQLLILIDLSFLEVSEVLIRYLVTLGRGRVDWKLYCLMNCIVHCQFFYL